MSSTTESEFRFCREQIILVRKNTNKAPYKQRVTNNSRWYREQSTEQQDASELQRLISEARNQRLQLTKGATCGS